ncbi:MAG: tyrosine-type recombinase/integrase [Aristaeellaceae bacterium]
MFLATGIRCGELCALHWDDIDLDKGIMNVRHTLVRLKGESIRTEPKTSGSKRRIVLPTYILDLLKDHRRNHNILCF